MEAGGAWTCRGHQLEVICQRQSQGTVSSLCRSSPSKALLPCRRYKVGSGGIIDTEHLPPRFSVCVLHACCVYSVRAVCTVSVQGVCGMRVCTVPVSCPVQFRSGSSRVGVLAELG